MNLNDFNNHAEAFIGEMQKILVRKGNDYTQGTAEPEDRVGSFKEAGKHLGLTARQVWAIHFWKHVTAVLTWAKTGKVESEAIAGRFHDIANYAVLGAALAAEEAGGEHDVQKQVTHMLRDAWMKQVAADRQTALNRYQAGLISAEQYEWELTEIERRLDEALTQLV